MNYDETLSYLLSKLPMYQRQGSLAFKKDLNNTLEFCKAADDPHLKTPVIHVAGTNGKGSVSHMLASVLQEHGYKTGLYTSPHLVDFRERIRLNGAMIPQEDVMHFTETFQPQIERIKPSFFEVTAVMAFWYFEAQEADIAVIETGLGGRLDSTNVVDPLLSVITNISLEHQNFLGDTIEAIAKEKAGIIKPGKPVVSGRNQENSTTVFRNIASSLKAEMYVAPDHYNIEIRSQTPYGRLFDVYRDGVALFQQLNTDIPGDYQRENILTVLTALDVLKAHYPAFCLDNNKIRTGLENIKANTGLRGRWEVMQKEPLLIADIAHNAEALEMIFSQVSQTSVDQLHIVYGTVREKNLDYLKDLFPVNAKYYLCEPEVERALKVDALEEHFINAGLEYKKHRTSVEALETALNVAGNQDMILVTGSAFVVSEILQYNQNQMPEPH